MHQYDVVIVGAGISGINLGYRLQERNPHLSYVILEGRHEIGGTWSLFKYPGNAGANHRTVSEIENANTVSGIRSDSDLFTFGFSWRPWSDKNAIAKADRIRDYVQESAKIHGIDKNIRFHHKVHDAQYNSSQKEWTVGATVGGTEKATFKGRFLVLCTGYYDYHNPLKSSIPGIDNFNGPVIHPQFWPEDLDYSGKNVVVIGSGATAVTLLPAMADTAAHVTMLQRSPGYVVSIAQEDGLETLIRNCFSWAPMIQSALFRAKWIAASMFVTSLSKWFPQFTRRLVSSRMSKALPPSTPLDPHFSPSYNPWEQRMCLCPDGDFFQSLKSGRSSVVTGIIDTVTSNAIKLTSGKELNPDIIVTATGLQLQFAGGIQISVDGKPFEVGKKLIWKGLMIEDLPNAAFSIGYIDASWTLGADATAQTICRLLTKMEQEGVAEVTPRIDEKEKTNMDQHPILRLTSTYVKKSAHLMPKSGDRGQWAPRSYYLKDILNAWYGDIRTGLEWSKA
jgi:cation diffusion facilitator CzcD-associated flavoprotein CzcO